MITLSPKEFGILFGILSRWHKPFYAFGSRAKGTHQKYSDLDLAYLEPIPFNILDIIEYELSESDFPYKVEFLDFHKAQETFQNRIKTDLVKLPVFDIKKPESPEDWEIFHHIIRTEIFEPYAPEIPYDEQHPSFSDPNYTNFLIMKDDTIIGILKIQARDHNGFIRTLAIIGTHKNHGYGSVALTIAERLLKDEYRCTQIFLHANPPALSFYTKNGYRPMHFEDTEKSACECIDMGKKLNHD